MRTPEFTRSDPGPRARSRLAKVRPVFTARAWHLINLPAGSDISQLRAQIGSLDREVGG